MILSVVSGTYNRLTHLQRMVNSARQSIGGRIPYEIVLVDGGSDDGTIQWCRRQQDVVLIEQGELLGAVKAFNAGAYKARGDYVILANDDVEFVGRSILRAYQFMQDNLQAGVGCFQQKRDGKPWHVEKMPAVYNGEQVVINYGQVCIVPKWLGDRVGWWGDYLHTYGGDNELSANIIELGFHVLELPCSCIKDLKVEDDLRVINNGDPRELARQGKPHPDTQKFYQKWRQDGMLGPVIRVTPQISNKAIRKRRILYAPIYEKGHELQHRTKRGLFDALGAVGVVYEHDYVSRGVDDLVDVFDDFQPDLAILQIQDARTITPDAIDAIRYVSPDTTLISWNGDYHPNNIYDGTYIRMMGMLDLAGFALASERFQEAYQSVNTFYWQIGYEEPDESEIPEDAPSHDVIFMGNAYSKPRNALGRFLHGVRGKGIDVGIYGSWPGSIASGDTLYDFATGVALYRSAKIAISDQQWPHATGYVSNRLFQAMAAGGCVVLQQAFDGMEEYLGLKNGVHLYTWQDYQDLGDLVRYILQEGNEQERQEVAQRGHEFMLENHSFDVRVQELMEQL